MERALKHKYSVGASVYFTASNVARPAASGTYEVIRLLPTDGDDCQYRIKSSTEAVERVAKASQLAISCMSCALAGGCRGYGSRAGTRPGSRRRFSRTW